MRTGIGSRSAARVATTLAAAVVCSLVVAGGPSPALGSTDVFAEISADRIVLGNDLVERTWTTSPFGTESIVDHRSGLTLGSSPDLRLATAEAEITGSDLVVDAADAVERADGGMELTMHLSLDGGVPVATRIVTVFPGVAGFEVRTIVELPMSLNSYTLDEAALPGASSTIHDFRAGYDWRGSDTPDWEPTLSPFGGHHEGDHRVSTSAGPGEALEGKAQWMSLTGSDGVAFSVLERNNYDSSRMSYDGTSGGPRVDLSHDLIYLGPFETDVHLGMPAPLPVRQRIVSPAAPLELERVFTGLAIDRDDEAWQYHRYLSFRSPGYRNDVVFNSNGVDAGRISTGAKDDMDLAEVERQAAIASDLGVDVFVLDDGWQAASGDWCPDSPGCPEPRGLYPDRFPDSDFTAVREAIGDMELGLWMSPMHFNPAAETYMANPQWNCEPIGEGLVAYNRVQPDSSSNEAGLGTWNPEATGPNGKLIDYIESRIERAITEWEVRYFKFDFLVWLDCAGVDTVTMYEYKESFTAMLDRLISRHPNVTFQIDETNDYRLFPFESIARGPSWYANGSPDPNEALHNLWVLSPYIPSYSLGQATLGGGRGTYSNDYLMAAALASHMTFFTDLTRLTPDQVADARRWIDLYHQHQDRFASFTYPLLDDPIAGDNWTALQPWNPDEGSGALLVFRQDSPEGSRVVPLRGIRGSGSFVVRDAMTGDEIGTFGAEELRAGLDVELAERFSAAVYLIDPAG